MTEEQKKQIDKKIIHDIVSVCLFNGVKFETLDRKQRALLIDMFQAGIKFTQDMELQF